jgi:hypothetical protein
MGGVVTLAGIAIFAVTEHIGWAWFAIVALVLLVVSFWWTAREEHGKRLAAEGQSEGTPDLDRLISEGHALKGMPAGPQCEEWRKWRQRANSRLRAQFGRGEAREFSRLGVVSGPAEHQEAIERQVSHLKGLRERPIGRTPG